MSLHLPNNSSWDVSRNAPSVDSWECRGARPSQLIAHEHVEALPLSLIHHRYCSSSMASLRSMARQKAHLRKFTREVSQGEGLLRRAQRRSAAEVWR